MLATGMRHATGSADALLDIEMSVGAARIAPDSTVCVTVYNEPLAHLLRTLTSLVRSFGQAQKTRIDSSREPCIAIMIDGLETADQQVIEFLQRAAMINLGVAQDKTTRLFFSKLSAQLLRQLEPSLVIDDLCRVAFVVGIKNHNRGKLHSHALYFGHLCARFAPKYCFQIDVGTVVAPDAVGAMLQHFGAHPEVGGLAATIMSELPDNGSVIEAWQFMDFALQAGVFWPAEVVSGHLSVLPGQFSGLRWEALSAHRHGSVPCSDHELLQACATDSQTQPLHGYLRGLRADSSRFERLMFLAEDRVIGNEIVLSAKPWRLEFCREAHATTDACTQFTELKRQRRRWNNSATASKLWLFGRWFSYLLRADRGATDKLRFSSAMLWQLVLVAQQLLAPAFLICLAVLVTQAVSASLTRGDRVVPTLLLGVSVVAGLLSLSRQRGSGAAACPWRARLRNACTFTAAVLMIWLLIAMLPAASAAALFVPMTLSIALACMTFKRHWPLVLTKAPEYFMVIGPVLQVVLWVYALLHLHDVTWGTKGLTASPAAHSGMRALRNALLIAWLAFNGLAVWAALSLPPFYFSGLNPVLEMLSSVAALTVVMAVAMQLYQVWLSRQTRAVQAPAFAVLEKANVDL